MNLEGDSIGEDSDEKRLARKMTGYYDEKADKKASFKGDQCDRKGCTNLGYIKPFKERKIEVCLGCYREIMDIGDLSKAKEEIIKEP